VQGVPKHTEMSQKVTLRFNLTARGTLAKKGLFVFLVVFIYYFKGFG